MTSFNEDGYDQESERADVYSKCMHNALKIMKDIPESHPQWAVEKVAERLAIAEMFIEKSGRSNDYEDFIREIRDEETEILSEVPEVARISSEELDFMLEKIEEEQGINDDGSHNE